MKTLFMLLLLTITSLAGNVRVTNNKNEAFAAINIVEDRKFADIYVYRSDNENEAKGKDYIWHYVKDKSKADVTVYFIIQDRLALHNLPILNVYFVNDRNKTGWRKQHFLRGLLK